MSSEGTNKAALEFVRTFSFPGFSTLGFAKGTRYSSAKATIGEFCFAVELSPGGDTGANVGYTSCYLRNASNKTWAGTIRLDLMSGETVAKTHEAIKQCIAPSASWGWSNFALRSFILDPANQALTDDCLLIRATVTMKSPSLLLEPAPFSCVKTGDTYAYKAGPDTAVADLLALHQALSSSHDFTIIAQAPVTSAKAIKKKAAVQVDNRIPAHKLILAARSPVFRAMLSSGMQEASANEMEITGYAVDAVRAFVRFLYCDACTDAALEQHGWDLLAMADKYDVPALRCVCESYLSDHVQQGNAIVALQRADMHNAPVLKRKALEYIAQHKKAASEDPDLLRELSSDLLAEVVCTLTK
jgi:hypothetical protein